MTTATPPQITQSPEGEADALFREAKRRERRRRAAGAVVVMALAGLVVGLTGSIGGGPPRRPDSAARGSGGDGSSTGSGHLMARGDGLSSVRFGLPQAVAIIELEKLLGRPEHPQPSDYGGGCTVDASMDWSSGLTAYFFHGSFVGYATSAVSNRDHGVIPGNVSTARGLRTGDTLAIAKRLYGLALTTSLAQGGVWFAAIPTGRLAGYLTDEIDHTPPGPEPRIADITAGSVGCPAVSP